LNVSSSGRRQNYRQFSFFSIFPLGILRLMTPVREGANFFFFGGGRTASTVLRIGRTWHCRVDVAYRGWVIAFVCRGYCAASRHETGKSNLCKGYIATHCSQMTLGRTCFKEICTVVRRYRCILYNVRHVRYIKYTYTYGTRMHKAKATTACGVDHQYINVDVRNIRLIWRQNTAHNQAIDHNIYTAP